MQLCMEKLKIELQFALKLETHLSFVNNLRVIIICFFCSLIVYTCVREKKKREGVGKGEKRKKEKD